jgi:hypothetical protein
MAAALVPGVAMEEVSCDVLARPWWRLARRPADADLGDASAAGGALVGCVCIRGGEFGWC